MSGLISGVISLERKINVWTSLRHTDHEIVRMLREIRGDKKRVNFVSMLKKAWPFHLVSLSRIRRYHYQY